ncbi:restriction endonuclease subunit S [Thermococcus sp.]
MGVVPQNFGNATFESKNIRVRVNTQKLLPEFFAIYSQTPKYMAQVKALAKIAVAQATITQKDLDNIKLPLPPLPEQKQIAEILSTVDKKLELLRKRRERLERIKRGLMKDLLTGRRRVRVE